MYSTSTRAIFEERNNEMKKNNDGSYLFIYEDLEDEQIEGKFTKKIILLKIRGIFDGKRGNVMLGGGC